MIKLNHCKYCHQIPIIRFLESEDKGFIMCSSECRTRNKKMYTMTTTNYDKIISKWNKNNPNDDTSDDFFIKLKQLGNDCAIKDKIYHVAQDNMKSIIDEYLTSINGWKSKEIIQSIIDNLPSGYVRFRMIDILYQLTDKEGDN